MTYYSHFYTYSLLYIAKLQYFKNENQFVKPSCAYSKMAIIFWYTDKIMNNLLFLQCIFK
jgi:hypothetical protein